MCKDLINGLFGGGARVKKVDAEDGKTAETIASEKLLTQQRLDQREVELRQRNAALIGGMRSLVSGSAGGAGFLRSVTRGKSDGSS